jgi:hypothetical protein
MNYHGTNYCDNSPVFSPQKFMLLCQNSELKPVYPLSFNDAVCIETIQNGLLMLKDYYKTMSFILQNLFISKV